MISPRRVSRLHRWPVLKSAVLAAVLGGVQVLALATAAAAPAGPPSYDDVPVLVCRLVVVESASQLVDKGTQLSESAFNQELERWRSTGGGEVIVDEGFLMPVGAGTVSPHFDSAGGQVVPMPGGPGVREPGLTLRMVAQAHGAKFQIAAAFGAWSPPGKSLKEGLTLTRLLRAPMEGRTAGVLASLQGSQAGKELEYQWETGLQQATAVSGHLLQGAGARLHHSVFILPIATRPSLVAQPGQPVRFQGGSLQLVEGRVPSSLFWRVVNHVRPDLARPPAYAGRVLDLYWPDEKWGLLVKTMQEAGGSFSALPTLPLAATPEPQRVVGNAMVVRWKWQMPLPSAAFTVDIEDPLSDGASGGEPLIRHCESHQGRWILFARPIGEETRLMAFRATFTGGETVPVKALAVTEETIARPVAAPVKTAVAVPVSPSAVTAASKANAQGPLDLYAGEWSGTINGQANSRVKMICNWNSSRTQLMRDSSVTIDSATQSPVYSSMIMKFDELTGKFHSQIVAKDTDTPSVAEGSYDAATKTFIWTAANDLTGYTMVTRAVFPRDGVMEWTQSVLDREGNLVSQGSGKNVRQRR
jgi:hypothetical protein